jgi:hypothetical protein
MTALSNAYWGKGWVASLADPSPEGATQESPGRKSGEGGGA